MSDENATFSGQSLENPSPARLTIVTPTKNCVAAIEGLIDALNNQGDMNFVWLVADACSTDGTVELVKDRAKCQTKVIVSEDFSIYHGMNKALADIDTDYYLVVGSDDRLDAGTVEFINRTIREQAFDLLFGAVMINGRKVRPGNKLGWLFAMHGVGSSHSVGTIIRTDLHKRFGAYSKRYPVLADQFFIKSVIYGGAKIIRSDQVFGYYSIGGFSGTHALDYLTDLLKLQLQTEKYWLLQLLLGFARLTKHLVFRTK